MTEMALKTAILHHLANDFYFTYQAQQPPEIGERVELVIDGQPMAFVVSRIEQNQEAVMTPAGQIKTFVTYTVAVQAARGI